MLAKTDTLEEAINAVADSLLPTPEGPGSEPPELPPIEEVERQPRRRKTSNLRYLGHKIHNEQGDEWLETIAFARPGFRITQVKRRTTPDGRREHFVVVTQRLKRTTISKKGNGNGS
jgi:hypothetical protein